MDLQPDRIPTRMVADDPVDTAELRRLVNESRKSASSSEDAFSLQITESILDFLESYDRSLKRRLRH